MNSKVDVYITGGGTGGHIYPALAIAKIVEEMGYNISYIGNKKRMEGEIVPKYVSNFIHINMIGLPRKVTLKFITFFFLLFVAFIKTFYLFIKKKPDLVIGTGGFVTFVPLVVGKLFKAKIVIHEQNSYPGIVNRIVSKFADVVFVGFEDVKKYLKRSDNVVEAGNPIFEQKTVSLKESNKRYNEYGDMVISIVGGSSGAKILNRLIENNIDFFKECGVVINLITGKKSGDYNRLKIHHGKNFYVKEYCNNMDELYQISDLIVCRSGAMTIFELIKYKVPAILIPYKYATANHQYYNAKYLADRGCAIIIKEDELESKFIETLEELLSDQNRIVLLKENYNKIKEIDSKKIIKDRLLTLIGE